MPSFTPPPVPQALNVVALDNTNYVRWGDTARSADDFAYYRVYLIESGGISAGRLEVEKGVDTLTKALPNVDIYR